VTGNDSLFEARPLWHFTCHHGYERLGRRGVLLPNPHPLIPAFRGLIWFTDEAEPERDDVGLTMGRLACDRMEYRYRIDPVPPSCVTWSSVRHACPKSVLRDLESFGKPESWWISDLPVQAVLEPLEVAA
jgi:hypothetical protein